MTIDPLPAQGRRFSTGPGALTRRTGLYLPLNLTVEAWQHIGRKIFIVSDSSAWWWGDWLIFGEEHFPDRYRRAVNETGLDYQTLRNYAWIARRFPMSRRRDKLSFQHHVVVAALPEAEQDLLLADAEKHGWSRNELRRRLRQRRSSPDAPSEGELVYQLKLDPARQDRWQRAASQANTTLADWIVVALDTAADECLDPITGPGATPDTVPSRRRALLPQTEQTTTAKELKGWWSFDEPSDVRTKDRSGNGHAMPITGSPTWTGTARFGGGYALDGDSQWLSTEKPPLRSDESLSIAAWVRLDSTVLGGELALRPDWYAVTAVSQDGPSRSPFYLGARLIDNPIGSGLSRTLRWNFTVSPVEGTDDRFDWVHAHAQTVIDLSELDRWTLLVGVYDLERRVLRLYVPSTGDEGERRLPADWPRWHAEGGLQLGRARFDDAVVDQWPGSVGQLRIYSGVLTKEDAVSLYTEDRLANE
ncbi:LmbU family transcriptional regulator [Actinomycetes bacterium KLBMP 9797]